jgi:hypothetical protein
LGRGGSERKEGKGRGRTDRDREAWTEMARVAYLVWTMVAAEYVFAQAMNTAAWLAACYRLLAGGDVGRAALGFVVRENWTKLPFIVWQLGLYLRRGLWPLVLDSLSCAVRGRPGLLMAVLGCVGSVITVLRYRSTFYIALEISNMFVFLGHLLVGSIVLGLEPSHKALGSQASCMPKEPGSRGKADRDEVSDKRQ